ncbi:5038_t:CDS:2, partial [Racocetra fulgida]
MSSQNLRSSSRSQGRVLWDEKKSSAIENFWKAENSVVKTLKRASTVNSINIINRMLDLHSNYNDALTNTTRENIGSALKKRKTDKTDDEIEYETDSSDTISENNSEENLDEPEMEKVTLSHKRKREVLRILDNQELYSETLQTEVNLLNTIQVPKIE